MGNRITNLPPVTSAYLLLTILGIWALLVIPVWMKDRHSDSDSQMRHFKNAMEQLSTDQLLPTREIGPQVTAKRAPRAGHLARLRRRVLIQRRISFMAVIVTLPLSLALQLQLNIPATIWAMPPMALIAHIVFVSQTRRKVQRASTPANRNGIGEFEGATNANERAAQRSAMKRSALRRLAETEPELDTSATESWQPAEPNIGLGAPWSAPEEVLPTYVTAPAATSVPRQIDRVFGEWNAEAMIQAAKSQQSKELADLVAAAQEETALSIEHTIAAAEDDPTTELPKIMGA